MNDYQRRERAFTLLVGAYVGAHVTANAMAAKLIELGGLPFTVGAIAYPVTYVLQDVLSERYGESRARGVVWGSFVGCIALVAFSALGGALPESSASAVGPCYPAVFDATPRIVAASLAAFLTGGLVDVRTFFVIRAWTGPNHLWFRKLGSTALGQAVDSGVFVVIAFGGILAPHELANMALAQYVLKAACAVGGLPVSYAALYLTRRA